MGCEVAQLGSFTCCSFSTSACCSVAHSTRTTCCSLTSSGYHDRLVAAAVERLDMLIKH
jgi:hypothetical protein